MKKLGPHNKSKLSLAWQEGTCRFAELEGHRKILAPKLEASIRGDINRGLAAKI